MQVTERSALTFDGLVTAAAAAWPDVEAFADAGRRLTFAELDAEVTRHARALLGHGIQPGDRVALWMANSTAWVVHFLAVARIGAVLVPVNTGFTTDEAAYVVGRSGAVLLLVGPGVRDRDLVTAAARVLEDERVSARGVLTTTDLLGGGTDVPESRLREVTAAVRPDDPVLILFTSGTTGFPKGVVQPQRLIANMRDAADRIGLAPGDITVMYLPLFHIFALAAVVSLLTSGARMVLMSSFSGAGSLDLLERERATVLYGVAAHYYDQLHEPSFADRDLSRVRLCISPGSADLIREVSERIGPAINCYGMTETTSMTTLGCVDDPIDVRAETTGRPLPSSEVRVVDAAGHDLPVGEVGEVLVRGPAVMLGYDGDAEATGRAIVDGWFHTGDAAARTEGGSLRFAGRITEMFKVGGENVDPMEVESALMRHPAVALASVVGVPDPRLGDVGVAHVTARAGEVLDPEDLRAFAREQLASFKVPRHFVQIDVMPLTASGKVRKFELREDFLSTRSTQPVPTTESR